MIQHVRSVGDPLVMRVEVVLVKLRARWFGPPPLVGDYLMSQTRPRYAYRVSHVNDTTPPVDSAEVHRLLIAAERVAATAVPKSARIHPWKWDRRESRKSSV